MSRRLLMFVALLLALPLSAAGQERPRVIVFTTGGTIASLPEGSLPGNELVGAVPEVLEYAEVVVEELYRIGSSQMTPDHWIILAKRINEAYEADPNLAGVVVTHGTDTIEETAYFLHLTVNDARPVVMVGSMRTPDAVSADGPANLINAVRVAVSEDSYGRGVLVVLNEDIASARDVVKTHNQRVQAFSSPGYGFLGVVDPDRIVYYRDVVRPHTTQADFDLTAFKSLPRVPLVFDYTGADGSMVTSAAALNPGGVVVGSFAGGRMSGPTRSAIEDVVGEGLPVVVASKVLGGRIVGSPAATVGALQVSDLPPHKARILLMLALTKTQDPTELQAILDRY